MLLDHGHYEYRDDEGVYHYVIWGLYPGAYVESQGTGPTIPSALRDAALKWQRGEQLRI